MSYTQIFMCSADDLLPFSSCGKDDALYLPSVRRIQFSELCAILLGEDPKKMNSYDEFEMVLSTEDNLDGIVLLLPDKLLDKLRNGEKPFLRQVAYDWIDGTGRASDSNRDFQRMWDFLFYFQELACKARERGLNVYSYEYV